MEIQLDGIALNYSIEKKKIRNVYFLFKPNNLIVRCPSYYSNVDIEDLIIHNKKTILKKLKKLDTKSKKLSLVENGVISIMGQKYLITFDENLKDLQPYLFLNKDNLINSLLNYSFPLFKEYCENRTKYFFDLMYQNAFKFPNIDYKIVKTYRGQYNKSLHKITYNISLCLVDKDCIDYVIVHELCHLKYMNHQYHFHNLLDKYLPNNKELKRKLNKEYINLC